MELHRLTPLLLLLTGSPVLAQAPPAARQDPQESTLHGDRRVDEYAWLRRREDPQVRAHLERENAYTNAQLKHTTALQQALYKEALGRIRQDDSTPPTPRGAFVYYKRTIKGQQYPLLCRRATAGGKEQVLVDGNALARGHSYQQLLDPAISDDDQRMAFGVDHKGDNAFTLQVKDLQTGRLGPEQIQGVDSAAFGEGDNLFYVVQDAAHRPYRLYHHKLGATTEDRLLYEEKDARYGLSIERSRSRAYLFLRSDSLSSSEVRYLPAGSSADPATWKVIAPREDNHEYQVDHGAAVPGYSAPPPPPTPPGKKPLPPESFPGEDVFFIRSNAGHKNFRVYVAPVAQPERRRWTEILGPSDKVVLEDLLVFQHHFVVLERVEGLQKLRVTDRKESEKARRISFPDAAYSLKLGQNDEYQSARLRFHFQSFVKQKLYYELDLVTGQNRLLKQTEVPGHDPARYEQERLLAAAPDGTPVPVSVVYKKGRPRDGAAPLLLQGYGAYGYPYKVHFSGDLLSLLDRGVVVAVAHVRGGGEMGRAWYDGGRLLQKKNSFTDLIAAAEALIKERFTAAGRIVLRGQSAGGLLVTAAAQLRPELWKAVVAEVPFVDVINTMLDETLPATITEFEEWGDPKRKEHYAYMKSYSPYDNLDKRDYPAMLLTAGLNDSQVMYWEPAKYAARLRARKTDKNPVLLWTHLDTGHNGASGRFDQLRQNALVHAFVLDQLGIRR